jgi:diguanylate cyclase (GGDEF)-like protein
VRFLPRPTIVQASNPLLPGRWLAALARRPWWLALVLVAAFAVLTSLFEGNSLLWTAFDNIGEALVAVLATIACAVRARREQSLQRSLRELHKHGTVDRFDLELQRQTRLSWSLLTVGVGLWAAGQVGWSILEIGLREVPSTPSFLDALFLSSSILIVAGLLWMVRTPAGHLSHIRGGVEALFLASGCVLLSWGLIGPTLISSHVPALAQGIELAYPVLDAMALAAVLFVVIHRAADPPAGLALLALGIACMAVSDSAFWYMNDTAAGVPGASPLDSGWVAGLLLIALAALRHRPAGHAGRALAHSRLMLGLPAVPTVVGMLILATSWLGSRRSAPDATLFGIVLVVVLLSVALLLTISYENRALTDNLERRVDERTAALYASENELRDRALHDSLTGLANRSLLADRATQALLRSQRSSSLVAIMVLDLDRFKLANDTLGHAAGDELLCLVAQRLQAAVRPQDTVARIGGDEFVVLVEAIERPHDAFMLGERIVEAMKPPFDLGGYQYTTTVSIGVAADSEPHSDFEQLLSDADVAMYAVKAGGRDAVELFQSSMHEQARERFQLQTELRDGLTRGEFWLLYQPEFDCTGKRLVGFEALVRWNHATRGLIPPERFIPLAEETGLIVPLGRWVLEESLRRAATWEPVDGSQQAPSISVNVSTVQLNSPSLVTDVHAALIRSGIEPGRVVLEITESALIDDSRRTGEVLHALKALGVRLAIDDFGTGYASISYLQTVPVDILKIDRSFITGSEHDTRGRELLEAIVNIGRVLSLVTVAEGVEQLNQLATVQQMGCDLVQGYIFGRPLPEEEALRVIAEHATSRPGRVAHAMSS